MRKYEWVKSEASKPNGNCAEVMDDGFMINVRNSTDPTNTVLKFTYAEWDAFTAGVRNDEFDRKPHPQPSAVIHKDPEPDALCRVCGGPLNILDGTSGLEPPIYVHSDGLPNPPHTPEELIP